MSEPERDGDRERDRERLQRIGEVQPEQIASASSLAVEIGTSASGERNATSPTTR